MIASDPVFATMKASAWENYTRKDSSSSPALQSAIQIWMTLSSTGMTSRWKFSWKLHIECVVNLLHCVTSRMGLLGLLELESSLDSLILSIAGIKFFWNVIDHLDSQVACIVHCWSWTELEHCSKSMPCSCDEAFIRCLLSNRQWICDYLDYCLQHGIQNNDATAAELK